MVPLSIKQDKVLPLLPLVLSREGDSLNSNETELPSVFVPSSKESGESAPIPAAPLDDPDLSLDPPVALPSEPTLAPSADLVPEASPAFEPLAEPDVSVPEMPAFEPIGGPDLPPLSEPGLPPLQAEVDSLPLACPLWIQIVPKLKKDFLPCPLTLLRLMEDYLLYLKKILGLPPMPEIDSGELPPLPDSGGLPPLPDSDDCLLFPVMVVCPLYLISDLSEFFGLFLIRALKNLLDQVLCFNKLDQIVFILSLPFQD